ncbi:MAG: DUF4411 family protein [Opitutae bacterium]|nr:DUF4411 family protein [Opitutae bacterium]
MSYLLDANALIEAKRRYYGFDICPGYWDALLLHHAAGRLLSIDRVQAELLRGNDELKTWTEAAPPTFFASSPEADVIGQYARAQAWAAGKPQFADAARAEFANKADAWLIAYAAAKHHVLVTHEEYAPDARRKVPMPNVCRDLGVEYTDVFSMLRALPAKFVLSA